MGNNLTQPDLDTMEKLVEIFDISMTQFFEYANSPEKIISQNVFNDNKEDVNSITSKDKVVNNKTFLNKSFPYILISILSLLVVILSLFVLNVDI